MVKHSPIGASSAHRWFECPGSINLIKKAPKQESSKYAEQGTAAHWALQHCLDDEKDPWDFVGRMAPNDYELEEEDIEAVIEAIELIDLERADGKYIVDTEIMFDLSCIFPGLFGTGDIVLRSSDLKTLKVFDYKHGKGVPVEVYENKQLLYYALGAINWSCSEETGIPLDMLGWDNVFDIVEIGIIQPRCSHQDGPLRKWEVPHGRLEQFAAELKAHAEATVKANAPLSAGNHCRWCPALPICGQVEKRTQELAKVDFTPISDPENLNLPEPEEMTPDRISKILRFEETISSWLTGVKGYAQELLNMGKEVPGYKLVAKRANRKWNDEEDAFKFLAGQFGEEELYESKFKSPAKIEKLLGKRKGEIKELWYKPEAGFTIAPEHDKRPAILAGPGQDFQELKG